MIGPAAERARAQLEGPPLPDMLAHVWQWFLALHRARSEARCGIAWTEIAAWCQLAQVRPTPFELQCLMALDAVATRPAEELQPDDDQALGEE